MWLMNLSVMSQNGIVLAKKEEEMLNELATKALAESNAMKELLPKNTSNYWFSIAPHL